MTTAIASRPVRRFGALDHWLPAPGRVPVCRAPHCGAPVASEVFDLCAGHLAGQLVLRRALPMPSPLARGAHPLAEAAECPALPCHLFELDAALPTKKRRATRSLAPHSERREVPESPRLFDVA